MPQTNIITGTPLRDRKEYNCAWYKANKERIRSRQSEAYQRFKMRHPGYDSRDSAKNSAKARKWRENNKDRVIEYRRKYRQENHEFVKEISKRWRQKNITRVLLTNAKRRAMLRKVTYEKVKQEDISNWGSRICGICNLLIEGKFHIDHITPLFRGGSHTVSNLQLAHPACNLRKHTKLTEELSGVI